MHIDPGDRRPEQAADADGGRTTAANAPSTMAPAVPAGRTAPADHRQSPDGESLAPEDDAEQLAMEGMDAERLAELRRRVLGGAYDAPAVADQIAQRLLQRGEL